MTKLNERQLNALRIIALGVQDDIKKINDKTIGGLYNRSLVLFITIERGLNHVVITEKGKQTLTYYENE